MKCVIFALFALIACVAAGGLLPYNIGYAAPYHHAYAAPIHHAYAAAPLHHAYAAAPLHHAYAAHYAAPIAHHYAAPIAHHAVAVAPAVKSGYVAATRGSLHTAPLPEGPFAASHHINTAPAPGTFY